jgi:redox-sensitive bicupin YhaK (pirin superfamily)
MITVRKSEDRGHANHGWLDTYHTFSFASYFDPRHTRFRALRVINEDWIDGGMGFGTHPHENMEIITYIIEGELEHKDSMGNGSVIRPGELQRMTAGTGITHSEFNPSDQKTHLLQIWIHPEASGLPPSYEQRLFPGLDTPGTLTLLASRKGENRSLTVHQDVAVYGGRFAKGDAQAYKIASGRHVWIQLVKGTLNINDTLLKTGDGAAVSDEPSVILSAATPCEFLLFDLA